MAQMLGWSSDEAALRLALKALQSLRVAGDLLRQKLQGHAAPQLQIFRLVHHPHASATQQFQHAVVGDFLATQT